MTWILYFYLLVPPYIMVEVDKYKDLEVCMFAGQRAAIPDNKGIDDWFCTDGKEIYGGRTY